MTLGLAPLHFFFLSPRKPLRWVFAGAPPVLPKENAPCTVEEKSAWGLNKRLRRKLSVEALGAGTDLRNLSVVSPRRTAFVRRGARPTLSAPLSATARAARSEAERAGPERCQIRQPPRKPHPPCGEAPSLFSKAQAHPAQASKSPPHRLARPPYLSKPAQTGRIWTQSAFSFDRERPFVSA